MVPPNQRFKNWLVFDRLWVFCSEISKTSSCTYRLTLWIKITSMTFQIICSSCDRTTRSYRSVSGYGCSYRPSTATNLWLKIIVTIRYAFLHIWFFFFCFLAKIFFTVELGAIAMCIGRSRSVPRYDVVTKRQIGWHFDTYGYDSVTDSLGCWDLLYLRLIRVL